MSDLVVRPCPTCEGKGYEVEEHIRVVAEHDPSCIGGSCESTCPIPVPYPEYEQTPCSSCLGLGVDGVLEAIEAAYQTSGNRRVITKAVLSAFLAHHTKETRCQRPATIDDLAQLDGAEKRWECVSSVPHCVPSRLRNHRHDECGWRLVIPIPGLAAFGGGR